MVRSEDLHSVMINRIPTDVTSDEVRAKFDRFGEIGDIFLPKHYDSGKGKGFGFVRFVEKRDMEDCLDECGDKPIEMDGEEIRVEVAKPRPDSRRRDDDRGGRGGDRGGDRGYYRDRRSPPRGGDRGGDRGYGRDRSPPRRDDRRGDDRRGGRY